MQPEGSLRFRLWRFDGRLAIGSAGLRLSFDRWRGLYRHGLLRRRDVPLITALSQLELVGLGGPVAKNARHVYQRHSWDEVVLHMVIAHAPIGNVAGKAPEGSVPSGENSLQVFHDVRGRMFGLRYADVGRRSAELNESPTPQRLRIEQLGETAAVLECSSPEHGLDCRLGGSRDRILERVTRQRQVGVVGARYFVVASRAGSPFVIGQLPLQLSHLPPQPHQIRMLRPQSFQLGSIHLQGSQTRESFAQFPGLRCLLPEGYILLPEFCVGLALENERR